MGTWEECSIVDLGTVNRGKSKHRPRNDKRLFGGKYPFLQTADIKKANLYITSYSETYSEFGLAQSKLWNKDTLCITIAANIAESAILKLKACFPDSVIGFIPYKDRANIKFVKYLLDEFKLYLQQISRGTTQDNLSLDKIKRIKFRVPNLKTQEKIADILSSYDDLIENNNRRIAILEQTAQELYKEWFVRFRFPGHEQTSFENGIPKGWEVKKVKEVVTRKEFGKLYKEKDLLSEGKVIVIDQSRKKFIGFHNEKPSHIATDENPMILFGDHSCKYQLMITPFSLAENVVPFVGNSIFTTYLFYTINGLVETTEYKRHWLELMNKKILVATNKLQLLFNANVINLLLQKNNLQEQNQNLIKQRDLLLPRLMSGKLEV